MEREILASVDREESRVAVLEDHQLVEYYIDRPLNQRIVGNIYLGQVENVLPGMQSAFVNVGLERNAFLFVDDVYPSVEEPAAREGQPRPQKAIEQVLHVGQRVLVQVSKEPVGSKGARVTRNVTLPGRYLVLMPAADYIGISRRIVAEDERERLRAIAQAVKPEGMGLIMRTAAEGHEQQELYDDVELLVKLWQRIARRAETATPPTLLHKDAGIISKVLRDELTDDVRRIVLDDVPEYERALELVETFAPGLGDRVELDSDRERPLFEKYGLEAEIERALSRRVWLKSGGYLVLDQAEALTVVDVNTGRFIGSTDLQATVFQTNLEAAREIARQIRLRDIGGIIIIDFIDMEAQEHSDAVISALQEALRADHTKTAVLGWTQLGLVEMTRKKGRQNLLEMMTRSCPYCGGRGRVLSEESSAGKIRRDIRRIMRTTRSEAALVEVYPGVASLLIGPGGKNLQQLEKETGRSVFIRGASDCHIEEMRVRALGERAEVERQAVPVRPGQTLLVKVLEAHASNPEDGIARVDGYVIDVLKAGDRVGQQVKVEIAKVFRTYAKAKLVDETA